MLVNLVSVQVLTTWTMITCDSNTEVKNLGLQFQYVSFCTLLNANEYVA